MSNAALDALASLGLNTAVIPANETPVAEAEVAAPVAAETAAVDAGSPALDVAPAAEGELAQQAVLGVSAPIADKAPAPAASGPAFKVGASEIFTVAELPSSKKAVAAKAPAYDLSDIPAPTEAGISAKLIRFEGGDEKKFTRSVRSAVTAANRATREAGQPGPFYTSQNHSVDGAFVGLAVCRTDVDPSPKTNDAE